MPASFPIARLICMYHVFPAAIPLRYLRSLPTAHGSLPVWRMITTSYARSPIGPIIRHAVTCIHLSQVCCNKIVTKPTMWRETSILFLRQSKEPTRCRHPVSPKASRNASMIPPRRWTNLTTHMSSDPLGSTAAKSPFAAVSFCLNTPHLSNASNCATLRSFVLVFPRMVVYEASQCDAR